MVNDHDVQNNCQFFLYTHISIGSLITDAGVPRNNDKHTGNYVTWLIHLKNSEIKIFNQLFNYKTHQMSKVTVMLRSSATT